MFSDQEIEPNPEKRETILSSIQQTSDLYSFIKQLLPNWIIHTCDGYTSEYSILETNWKNLCNEWNTTPQKILIVSYLPSQEEFKKLQSPVVDPLETSFQILGACCNRLTAKGFVIRAETELVSCKRCKQAMLSKRVYEYLQQNKSPILSGKWNECCRSCLE